MAFVSYALGCAPHRGATCVVSRQDGARAAARSRAGRGALRVRMVGAEAVPLDSGDAGEAPIVPEEDPEELYRQGRTLGRIGWLAWWIELPLTATSAAILGFSMLTNQATLSSTAAFGLGLGVIGAISCLVSLILSWSYAALGRRMMSGKGAPILRIAQLGLYVSIAGVLVAIFGVQSIVGTTLGKALSTGLNANTLAAKGSIVAPLDLLIIQGCVNAVTCQFVALVTALQIMLRYQKK